jgi:hypothetical protein
VFIFMMALLVIGATIIVGYKLIVPLTDSACDTNLVSFRDELSRTLSDNSVSGSKDEVSIRRPCADFLKLCFLDVTANDGPVVSEVSGSTQSAFVPFIRNAVTRSTGDTVFLETKSTLKPISGDERITVERPSGLLATDPNNKYLCIQSKSDKFTFIVEGRGRRVLIKAP